MTQQQANLPPITEEELLKIAEMFKPGPWDSGVIAHGLTILPRLLKEWREMKEELNKAMIYIGKEKFDSVSKLAQKDAVIEKMKNVLEFYGEGLRPNTGIETLQKTGVHPAQIDGGLIARQCLEEIKGELC